MLDIKWLSDWCFQDFVTYCVTECYRVLQSVTKYYILPSKPHQTNFVAVPKIKKIHFAKKLGKIDHFCPQQGPKQSTASYTGLPVPTTDVDD